MAVPRPAVTSSSRRRRSCGITVTDKDVATRLDADQEAVLQRQRGELPEAAEGSRASPSLQLKRRPARADPLGEALQRSHRQAEGHRRRDHSSTTTTNKAQYGTAASRDVRHILVNNKTLADTLETQLKDGGDFAALAKKYSKDPGSAKLGGKLDDHEGPDGCPSSTRPRSRSRRTRSRRRCTRSTAGTSSRRSSPSSPRRRRRSPRSRRRSRSSCCRRRRPPR